MTSNWRELSTQQIDAIFQQKGDLIASQSAEIERQQAALIEISESWFWNNGKKTPTRDACVALRALGAGISRLVNPEQKGSGPCGS